ncbi:bifunctional diguanylate cyclase/phosphodiesterase [Vibrio sp. SCSIO 43137]|uniref:bifunctional diguanylate cyclase/phosphodiesterase n=1 Tax=Vibrio sp. SCSIO 43137 TaxID=3021011 RepID=UPI00230820B8|nr:EAL domain-containing protein [Vibrio sp. SCSIO 43137]WCE28393.1 EAL domain-containing protein [Vibrio sp. SCSIO 43137]
MALVKKNIWTLFWTIILLSVLLFSYYGYYLWKRNQADFHQFQYTQVNLFSDSVEAFLKSQESLLQVLGSQLAVDNQIPQQATHSATLDRVRKNHPFFAGFGLANLNGDLRVVSSNLNLEKLPNLLEQEVSRNGFMQTLRTTKLVAGRTYQLKALDDDSIAIAIRKAILSDKGDAVAVMTAGVKVNETVLFNNKRHSAAKFNELDIIRDDGYLQFYSGDKLGTKSYTKPVPLNTLQALIDSVLLDNDVDLETLKSSRKPWATEFVLNQSTKRVMMEYDPYFQFWIVSTVESSYVNSQFLNRFLFSLVISIASALVFYMLVRSIAVAEQDKYEQLLYQTRHDLLTDLPNQVYLSNLIDKSQVPPFATIFINIDRFKSVNDSYGHEFGDKVIKEVASRLMPYSESKDCLIRGTGDEFMILTSNLDDEWLITISEKILEKLSLPFVVGEVSFLLTASIGIAKYPPHGSNYDELIRSLDFAMLQAKKTKNAIYFYSPRLQSEHVESLYLEQKLRQAIKEDQITLLYQPQVNAQGELYGAEALARWTDDELGFVPPDRFIAIAEQSGLMPALGQQIITIALSEITPLRSKLSSDFRLSINISVKQFMMKDFYSQLLTSLDDFGFPPSSVTLEITENLFIEDLDKVKPICDKLIQKGIIISLDDFGTGYSSLSILRDLPIKELKIDKSFVDNIDSNGKSKTMIRNIIEIGKNYRMNVLAEGVETESQKQVLSQLGCDHFQGYLYSKPISSSELSAYSAK